MSFRNDHDAAIARVDALTQELDHTQAEREHLQAERDRLQVEVKRLREIPPAKRRGARYAFMVLAAFSGIVIGATVQGHHWSHTDTPPAAPQPEPPRLERPTPPSIPRLSMRTSPNTDLTMPPARTTSARRASMDALIAEIESTVPTSASPTSTARGHERSVDPHVDTVVACATRTQRQAESLATLTDLKPLRATCRRPIESMIRHSAITADARELLTRWLALEDRLAPTLAAYNTYVLRDPRQAPTRAPAALREEFHATLRARTKVLTAVPDALARAAP